MAPKKGPLTTAAEMAPEHLPEHARPEEFLSDADLVGYHERALAELSSDDDGYAEAKAALLGARKARAMTAETIAEIEEEQS